MSPAKTDAKTHPSPAQGAVGPSAASHATTSSPGGQQPWARGAEHILLKHGVVTLDLLEWAAKQQGTGPGSNVLRTLIDSGKVDEIQALQAVAADCRLPFMRLSVAEVDGDVFALLSPEDCETYGAIPIRREGDALVVATSDPLNVFLADDLKRQLTEPIRFIVSPRCDLKRIIEDLSPGRSQEAAGILPGVTAVTKDDVKAVPEQTEEVGNLEVLAGESPVIRYVDSLIASAVKEGASDIHIEPEEDRLRIRFRIDGVLFERPSTPPQRHQAVISRLKIMADLDVSERRLPQDGRIRVAVEGRNMALCISTFPMTHGEKCVIRILDDRMTVVGLERLGMADDTLEAFREQIRRPTGMLLVTGPAGSGKSTTLYSALRDLDRNVMNVCTLEDPVEYELPSANQAHIRESLGLTFAAALRSLLRQDPDVILVGEIRDEEAARTALQAALTGHLVLSTLLAADAPASITRLMDMGADPYLVTASVNAVLAQRLARQICQKCRTPVTAPNRTVAAFLEKCGASPGPLFRGAGCEECRQSGYKGRTGLYELLVMDDDLRELINHNHSLTALRRAANGKGMRTLAEDGLQKVAAGLTTVEEVMRVIAL
jgi:type IV pilus assembly protein PilB